jgi:acetyltransferase-like isoleucine patch superfamily enzyme
VAIVGVDHRTDVPGKPMIFSGRPASRRTVICDDVWIGIGTVVMQGVRIGRGAVIGANSFVNRDVPPFEIWVGAPARRVGERFPDPEQRHMHTEMLDGPPVHTNYCS